MPRTQPTFEQALLDLPSDVDYDPLAMKTVNDMVAARALADKLRGDD